MIEIFGTVATVLAVAGVLLNNHRRRECFLIWIVSNAMTFAIHAHAGIASLAVRDAIFLALALDGWNRWRK